MTLDPNTPAPPPLTHHVLAAIERRWAEWEPVTRLIALSGDHSCLSRADWTALVHSLLRMGVSTFDMRKHDLDDPTLDERTRRVRIRRWERFRQRHIVRQRFSRNILKESIHAD